MKKSSEITGIISVSYQGPYLLEATSMSYSQSRVASNTFLMPTEPTVYSDGQKQQQIKQDTGIQQH